MPPEERRERPALNPVLTLRKEAVPETVQGRGASEAHVVQERLSTQRRVLADKLEAIAGSGAPAAHAGRIHLAVEMFEDSFAPSWTPRPLFADGHHVQLVAPARNGYLVEAEVAHLQALARHIRQASAVDARVAISRVRDIRPYGADELLRGREIGALWDRATEVDGGKAFVLWLLPFRDESARASVVQTLMRFESERAVVPTFSAVEFPLARRDGAEAIVSVRRDETNLARTVRRYRGAGHARGVVTVPSRDALQAIVLSGSSFRIDPVPRIEATSPGIGAEPTPPVPNAAAQPIVAVIDGGMTAQSYAGLEAWRAPDLVPPVQADHAHGNRVSSLVVHGYAWNNRLNLPQLDCRIGTVRALPRSGANYPADFARLVDYLHAVARAHPETRVWNISLNAVEPEADADLVSFLGDEIRVIAREHNILPVISIGNRRAGGTDQLCAPADCEAALTVGGRAHAGDGVLGGACSVSLRGPGPEGMLKPDLSWFSNLRMIGGGQQMGSSFAAPLVSSLAAHTFANLRDPTPDLVRALIINLTELEEHHAALGWGTPHHDHLPWTCAPGSVTLAWRAKMRPGFNYYWRGIPIPPELIRDGKLVGKGRLTAILDPIVSISGGPNYFATRLQASVQYTTRAGGTSNLLGSMREDRAPEREARADLAKWHPVRRHIRDFSKRGGITFSGDTMSLHARVFARDLFQFDAASHHELGEQDVSFVLTLSDGSNNSNLYNSMAQQLGTFVESAVVEQNVELEQ
ncbi:S8 family peptidase [Methylobacterium sp. Leaf466]|uniref:S8 family peptidase n=1 Tax=Methylobacterium sp. Leaf466 TaxID=1736386 RepID=UPI00070178EF|nr:S8 family peptidase [Methylobacterium sp. Leaf466]KQT80555.1 hypothetical protein ASG59_03700 [Methylobacterium sp. Leaf466]